MMVRACVRSCVCKPNRDRKGAGPPWSMAASLRARFGEHRFDTRSQKIIETRDGSGNMVHQFIERLTRRTPRSGDAALRHAGVACSGESRAGVRRYIDDP